MLPMRDMNRFHGKGQNSTNSPDDLGNYDGYVAMLVISIVFLLLGVFGNIAVVVYNVCLNRDKTSSSWLVTHFPVADLFVCFTVYTTKMVKFFIFRSQTIPFKATKQLYNIEIYNIIEYIYIILNYTILSTILKLRLLIRFLILLYFTRLL